MKRHPETQTRPAAAPLARPARAFPVATYRLQFNADFTLAEAERLVGYMDRLGITDCYASPLLKASPGSAHGYDVIDPTEFNPELGGERGLRRLARALRARGMGLVLDVVPNHMSVASPQNRWWWDVLEFGPGSPYATFFDVQWKPARSDLENRVLLPVLSDRREREIERGRIRIAYRAGTFVVWYGGSRYPLTPRSQVLLLDRMLGHARTGPDPNPHVIGELEAVRDGLAELPWPANLEPGGIRAVRSRRRELAGRLRDLLATGPAARTAAFSALAELNAKRKDPTRVRAFEELLSLQAYQLAFWEVASNELNYRRFFDINELAALRMEEPEAFRAVHQSVLDQVRAGRVTGLRIDHIDGLANPAKYLHDLQRACKRAVGRASGARSEHGCYIVVEKILECDERLRRDWQADGTTGYDALNVLNGLFVERRGVRRVREIYAEFTGSTTKWDQLRVESRIHALRTLLASEVQALLHMLSERPDLQSRTLEEALVLLIANLRAYRTYVDCAAGAIEPADRRLLETAAREAKRMADLEAAADIDRLLLLLTRVPGDDWQCGFIRRFQQAAAATAAKGVEDTAFYRYYPLSSLNEVGGNPASLGMTPARFHARSRERLRDWPHSMVATSTHDTKRSEDVRSRIHVLSEMPAAWRSALGRWARLNAQLRDDPANRIAPDANEEYLLYQTLVGTWPGLPDRESADVEFADRIVEYMRKALREAKLNTSWTAANPEYEDQVERFVRDVLDPARSREFLDDLNAFTQAPRRAGMLNSLAQLLLKVASPGVPDFYQGSELWNLQLVDPDNRRSVDYELRMATLQELSEAGAGVLDGLLNQWEDGRLKLWVTARLLQARREEADLFAHGDHQPLAVRGEKRNHVIAFARRTADRLAIAVAARFFVRLGIVTEDSWRMRPEAWGGTGLEIPPGAGGDYTDVLTGERLRLAAGSRLHVADVLAQLPGALLVRSRPGD